MANDRYNIVKVLHSLTSAADSFVNRAPRVKRIEIERTSLLDAITEAQLVLSVHRLPADNGHERASKSTSLLKEQIKTSQASFNQLERRLAPLTDALATLQSQAERARALLDTALTTARFTESKKAT